MKPHLSIVATSRNDNHGEFLLKRMQIFVNGIIEQSKKYDFNTELILVEWNPPEDKLRLKDALKWPDNNTHCDIRIIEVPADLHRKYKYSEGLPLFQMIAKNVGIVRANAEFVLSTNIDIIFSNELMEFLSSGVLQSGKYYRVDRHDVSRDMYQYDSVNELLNACDKHTIRISHRNGITDCINNVTDRFFPEFLPVPFMGKRLWLIPGWKYVVKQGDKKLVRAVYRLFGQYRNWLRLHTNACGDFMLMSKMDWLRIRGAPELEIFSLHLDSLVCYIAYFADIEEVVIDAPIYHIEHDSGWTPEAEKDGSLYKRLEVNKVPFLTIKELDAWISEMYRKRAPLNYNDENWGLARENLKETVIN